MEQLHQGFSYSTQKAGSDGFKNGEKNDKCKYNLYPLIKLAPKAKSNGQVISNLVKLNENVVKFLPFFLAASNYNQIIVFL